jgi:putative ABC transport system permease protein
MISKESISYSLRNLKNSKGRSALTVFSILIGITTLFIFISFGIGLYVYIDEIMSDSAANKIMIQAKGSGMPGLDDTFKLTDDDINIIEKTPGVDRASGNYFKPAQIEQDSIKKYSFLIGYDPQDPQILEISSIGLEKGRWLRDSDSKKVILGYNYLHDDRIFPDAYDLGKKILVQGEELRIIGFLEEVGNPQDDSQIYTTNNYLLELYPNTTSYAIIVAESDSENIKEVVERLEDKLRKSRGQKEGEEDFYVQSYEELLNSYLGAMNIIIGFIIIIALVSVLVSSVNTANTMITSVLERYKEIGILKAVGARNAEIFKIFLFESAFLGFVAGSLGTFFGWLFSSVANGLLDNLGYGFLSAAFPLYLFVGCILFATITGAVSGVFPAINASRTNTVDALRYE